jgi:hypothetical protein
MMLVQQLQKITEGVKKMAVPIQAVGKAVNFFQGIRDVFTNVGSVLTNGVQTQAKPGSPGGGNIFGNLFGGKQTPTNPNPWSSGQ